MFSHYLSKLELDQLLCTDTDTVIVYEDLKNPNHIQLPTSDMLGDLKDEYAELLAENPNWYIHEFIAFGPKMYQLVLRDKESGKIEKWDKTMKGICLKGNQDMFTKGSLPKYRNPVLDYCSVLQYGLENHFNTLNEVQSMMRVLSKNRETNGVSLNNSEDMSISIRFNQNVFKRKISHIFTDEYVMSVGVVKDVHVTQSKRYLHPFVEEDCFGQLFCFSWKENGTTSSLSRANDVLGGNGNCGIDVNEQ